MSESPDTQAEAGCIPSCLRRDREEPKHLDHAHRNCLCPCHLPGHCRSCGWTNSHADWCSAAPTPSAEPDGEAPYEFDVRNFGAIGDGITDDTAAVQAAFDAHPAPTQDGAEVEDLARLLHARGCVHPMSGQDWKPSCVSDALKLLASDWLAQRDKDRDAAVAAKVLEGVKKVLEDLFDATGDSDALGRRHGVEWVEAACDGIDLAIDAVTAAISHATARLAATPPTPGDADE